MGSSRLSATPMTTCSISYMARRQTFYQLRVCCGKRSGERRRPERFPTVPSRGLAAFKTSTVTALTCEDVRSRPPYGHLIGMIKVLAVLAVITAPTRHRERASGHPAHRGRTVLDQGPTPRRARLCRSQTWHQIGLRCPGVRIRSLSSAPSRIRTCARSSGEGCRGARLPPLLPDQYRAVRVIGYSRQPAVCSWWCCCQVIIRRPGGGIWSRPGRRAARCGRHTPPRMRRIHD